MNDNELMKTMPVPQAVAKMAIPSIISSLVTVVYNMADTFFVGQTGDPLQVAAVSLTNPIFILFMAFANMFGMGGSAAASIAMGENNKKRMKQVSAFITYASLGVGIVFAALLLLFMQPILGIFGANAETYDRKRICLPHFLRRTVHHLVRSRKLRGPLRRFEPRGDDRQHDRNCRQHRP